MRQRRWFKLVKDYDCEILYQPGKANVVVDALSRRVTHSVALITKQAPLLRDFERAEITILVGEVTSQLAQLTMQPTLRHRIIVSQLNDPYLIEKHLLVEAGQSEDFSISSNDGLTFDGRLCVPEDSAVKPELLTEAHSSPFTMHPESTKMYQDLRRAYWWRNMKREVDDFVSRCLVCQQVKAPRQKLAGLLQPLESRSQPTLLWGNPLTLPVSGDSIYDGDSETARSTVSIISDRYARFTSKFWKGLQLALGTRLDFSTVFHLQTDGQTERLNQVLEDMLQACVLEFSGSWDSQLHLMEFTYNNSYQATIGMTPFEALYGKCCRSLVYWGEVGEQRMLGPELVQTTNVAIQKIKDRSTYEGCVLRFEKKGKLSPCFVGPFEILKQIGSVAYRLALPLSFSAVHDVFHVSMLRSYEEQPVEILAREVEMLRNRGISLVKVLWRNHGVEEATWEREEDMRSQYPELRVAQPRRRASSAVRRNRETDPHPFLRSPPRSVVVYTNPLNAAHFVVDHRSSPPLGQHHIVERPSPTVSAVARTQNPTCALASLHHVKPTDLHLCLRPELWPHDLFRAALAQSTLSRARKCTVAESHSRCACPSRPTRVRAAFCFLTELPSRFTYL
ncbi:pol protein [Cucumis melo var. makuwa]|uniref:Pol protein n=1 Tax=Cucumis melo var. makuwa TaxID=1194695 RepID=A0A5A7UPX6_CUCMM|nr:pol protein [Cucumis melo var. makuwa]TYK27146.1 pol protein [Cucumis melo var. makuwa]